MPNRIVNCLECGTEIDTDYDDYHRAACGCCWTCTSCWNGFDMDDDGPSDDYDDGYGRDRRVHSWDYRPDVWRPKGNYPAQALLGLELEIGGRERDIAPIVAGFDPTESHLYMKQDGSITGVEIVTHPATLEWSRGFDWDSLLRDLRNGGSEIDDGYGLHIHVSRNAFRRVGYRSTPHQMSWLMFMYRHSAELEKLARRSSSRWAKFGEPAQGELKRKSADMPSDDDRYVAVNCNNAKTYELRFFKSTLETHELYAALEFADASVEYTRGVKASDVLKGDALTWSHFVAWVSAKTYPNLSRELERVNAEIKANAERLRLRRAEQRAARDARRDAARAAMDADRAATVDTSAVFDDYSSVDDYSSLSGNERDRSILTAGTGGVIRHSSSGERFAVGRYRNAWWMRSIDYSVGFNGSWRANTTFVSDGWEATTDSAPVNFFPISV